MNITLRCRYWI